MRYELSGRISDTHTDMVDVTALNRPAEFRPGRSTITVHSGSGSIELPWDAHPMLRVGTPVKLIIEVEDDE